MEKIDSGSEQPSTPIGSTNVDVEHDNTSPNVPSFEESHQSDAVNPPNKIQKSIAWDQFVKVTVNGKLKAQCKTCNALLGADPKNGTKHLLVHREKCIAKGQTGIRQKLLVSNSKTDLSTYVYNENDSRNALAKMVILHEYPLSIVDHVGFKNFTRTIQPLFKCPCQNTLKSDIKNVYAMEKSKVIQKIENLQGRISITTDMWTSTNQKKGHYIHDWCLQSKILRFVYVPCPHTSEVLTDVLIDALMEWNVGTKLSTITVDICTTNDALIGKIKEKLQINKLIHDGTHIHMICAAHILNLVVKIGLKVIKGSIENVRESVACWTATPKRVDTFESSCRQLKIPYSTYLMLKVALMYKEVFGRLKQRDSQHKTLPSSLDWENAQEICGRLELFYNVTAIFSGTKYPTANLYFPKICEIRLELSKWNSCSNIIVQKMATQMIANFNHYWGSIHELIGVAAIFDPRYKMEMIEFYFQLLYPKDYVNQVSRIKSFCDDLVKEYKEKSMENSHRSRDYMGSGSTNEMDGDENLSAWYKYVKAKNRVPQLVLKTEFDRYLEEGIEPESQDFDILMWWKLRATKYPILQAIARDILAIPVSTVASKSAFSTSGRLISPHRSRLKPNTIEALMCAQSWLWEIINKVNHLFYYYLYLFLIY
uniref:BED-type domain-containing protein n=1 Tax=Lactuca sativa TaxID=4236 RepID=A0A9R1WEY6_LACSA|nr:hypothetical protein LSAT_V11C200064420 [Lactuca sativa]